MSGSKDMLDMVAKLLDEHSGGIKFTELVSYLVRLYFETGQKWSLDPDEILAAIVASARFGVLHYNWRRCGREKIFVYEL